jgi:hypothetical protein
MVCCLLLFTGCAVSSINVLEKKETPKPFSSILVVYVDGDIDFSVFDSLTYDICLRPSFIDTSSLEIRSNTEVLLSDALSAPRSVFFRASDFFGPDLNSFADFNTQMDSLHTDAILLIHTHHYTYTRHDISVTTPNGSAGQLALSTTTTVSFGTPNAAFACYLIRPHEYLPVWRAEVAVKGKSYNGKRVLRSGMISKLENSLVTGGYLAPHRKGS